MLDSVGPLPPLVSRPLDLLIAASALEQRARLVTHNTKEFRRVKGLGVEDWY